MDKGVDFCVDGLTYVKATTTPQLGTSAWHIDTVRLASRDPVIAGRNDLIVGVNQDTTHSSAHAGTPSGDDMRNLEKVLIEAWPCVPRP